MDLILEDIIEKVIDIMNILPSRFYDSQTWGALQKCWVGYVIGLKKGEFDNEIKYANRIQNLQKELGLEVEEFKCLEGVDEEDIKLIEKMTE